MKSLFILLILFIFFSFPSLFSAPEKKKSSPGEVPPKIILPLPDSAKLLQNEDPSFRDLAFFLRSLAIIRKAYVDEKKVSEKDLLKKALRGLLRELDPYSTYESPAEAKVTRERTTGNFAGIGVTVRSLHSGAVEIITVFEGSPAEKAGLRTGDFIAEVNGEAVSGHELDECVQKIKGEIGTSVKLKILRRETPGPFTVTLRRGVVKVSSIMNPVPLEPGIGYLRISSFTMSTPDDLRKALEKFPKDRFHSLVIDLRNNPGGLLDSAIGCCSLFLPTGKEVVSTAGRTPASGRVFKARESVKRQDLSLVILINGASASAAEIMAGCLRDHNCAVLVGTKSFGKGSVQSLLPLGKDDGTIRLTTARYFTPSRKMIHGVGIQPDIAVPVPPALQLKLSAGLLSRHLKAGAVFNSFAREDLQLARARELLRSLRILRTKKK